MNKKKDQSVFSTMTKSFMGVSLAAMVMTGAVTSSLATAHDDDFAPAAAVAQDVVLNPQYQSNIEQIKSQPKVQAALQYAQDISDKSLAQLIELTEIPAPPFKEEKRAARYAEMLKEAGADKVWMDEVGNVIALREGTVGAETVAMVAHLDTVFPEGTDVTVREVDGKLYAPGIGDDTRGLVMQLAVLDAIESQGVETEDHVLFIGSVGEEGLGDLRGVKHLFREGGPKIDTFIAVDGGDLSRLVYGGIGSYRYRVTFKGPGGHSWGAFGLANPHHALGRAMRLLAENGPSVTSVGPKSSFSVGRIGGGTSINSIPFESWMEVDMRSGAPARLDAIDAVFKAAMQQALEEENAARQHGPALTVDVDQVGLRPAGLSDPNGSLVQHMMAALKSYGVEPSLAVSSTDSNVPISLGIPAITISRGGKGGRGHAPDEWWQDVDAYKAVQVGLLTLLAETKVAQ